MSEEIVLVAPAAARIDAGVAPPRRGVLAGYDDATPPGMNSFMRDGTPLRRSSSS